VNGNVINYGSGSDFLTSYGSSSASQKVTVLTVPVPQHWSEAWTPGSGFVPKKYVTDPQHSGFCWRAGRGAYGVVEKMKHKQTGTILAVKRITATVNSVEQRRLLMDLDISMRSSGRFVCATSLLVTVTRI